MFFSLFIGGNGRLISSLGFESRSGGKGLPVPCFSSGRFFRRFFRVLRGVDVYTFAATGVTAKLSAFPPVPDTVPFTEILPFTRTG